MVWNDDAGISYPTSRMMVWWACDFPFLAMLFAGQGIQDPLQQAEV